MNEIQTTVNTDNINILVEDGEVENVYNENHQIINIL